MKSAALCLPDNPNDYEIHTRWRGDTLYVCTRSKFTRQRGALGTKLQYSTVQYSTSLVVPSSNRSSICSTSIAEIIWHPSKIYVYALADTCPVADSATMSFSKILPEPTPLNSSGFLHFLPLPTKGEDIHLARLRVHDRSAVTRSHPTDRESQGTAEQMGMCSGRRHWTARAAQLQGCYIKTGSFSLSLGTRTTSTNNTLLARQS